MLIEVSRPFGSNFGCPKVPKGMKSILKQERKKRKITQEQLAHMVGVSRQSINAIERGKYTPSTVLSLKISEIFNTSVNKLFELEASDYQA